MVGLARRTTEADPGRVRRHVAVSAAITALGGLLFGYDTGVVSGALLFVKKDFGGLSSFQQELVTSLLLVGAVVGALGAGRVADQIGRLFTVLLTALVFIVGVLLAAFTPRTRRCWWRGSSSAWPSARRRWSCRCTSARSFAEIYPLKIRGAAMSVASMANWAANFVVTISFLTLLSAIGGVGAFSLFGFLTLVAARP